LQKGNTNNLFEFLDNVRARLHFSDNVALADVT